MRELKLPSPSAALKPIDAADILLRVAASNRSNDFVYNLVSAEHVAHNLSPWKSY